MNTHRDVIYSERDRVLSGEDLRDTIVSMVEEEVEALSASTLEATPPTSDRSPAWVRSYVRESMRPPSQLPLQARVIGSSQVLVESWRSETLSIGEIFLGWASRRLVRSSRRLLHHRGRATAGSA